MSIAEEQKHWHLQGNWAPVFEEVESNNLEINGEVP